jgi:hypothetical protein
MQFYHNISSAKILFHTITELQYVVMFIVQHQNLLKSIIKYKYYNMDYI